jgi:hypothetical protein
VKTYFLSFGNGDPRTLGGMNATFLIFKTSNGSDISPPGITEIPTSTGIHYFNWGTTTPIAFLADAATTSPGAAARYIPGAIDPADRGDEYGNTLFAIGTSLIAQSSTLFGQGVSNLAYGNSNFSFGVSNFAFGTSIYALSVSIYALGLTGSGQIGTTASSFGSTSVDPSDLFGYLKRIQENLEGDQRFIKSSGVLDIYNRGSSTLLREKTITNSSSSVIKL